MSFDLETTRVTQYFLGKVVSQLSKLSRLTRTYDRQENYVPLFFKLMTGMVSSIVVTSLRQWWLLLKCCKLNQMQVLRNCRSISKQGFPFRSMVATGGFRQKTQLESLKQDLDVLIATPGRFMYLIKEGFLQLTNLRWHVFSFLSLVMMLSFIGFARVLLYTVSLLYVLECFFKKVYSNTRFCSSFLQHCCYEYLCYLKSSTPQGPLCTQTWL